MTAGATQATSGATHPTATSNTHSTIQRFMHASVSARNVLVNPKATVSGAQQSGVDQFRAAR